MNGLHLEAIRQAGTKACREKAAERLDEAAKEMRDGNHGRAMERIENAERWLEAEREFGEWVKVWKVNR